MWNRCLLGHGLQSATPGLRTQDTDARSWGAVRGASGSLSTRHNALGRKGHRLVSQDPVTKRSAVSWIILRISPSPDSREGLPMRANCYHRPAVRSSRLITIPLLVASLTLLAACPSHARESVGGSVSAAYMAQLAHDSHLGLNDTSPPGQLLMAKVVGAVSHSLHPRVIYVGAEYCPFCAALRWPLVLTLLRFGKLSGLEFMRSSPTDVFADTPTLSFYRSHYSSSRVVLHAFETATRFGAPLQHVPHAVNEIFDAYDAPPFTEDAGAIPFLYINGLYVISGSPISPAVFAGKTWRAIASELGDPHSQVYQKVMPVANAITAAICVGMHAAPRPVCDSPGVLLARQYLPHS